MHYAALTQRHFPRRCIGADKLVERVRAEPEFDLHQEVANLCECERPLAKTLNLGMIYGMGQTKLGATLGVPIDQAERLLRTYKRAVPFIYDLSRVVMEQATKRGYISTILGRRRRFVGSDAHTYKALNALIQGSAADMTKQAMVNIYEDMGLVPLLTVHDELDYSIAPEEAEGITEHMRSAVPLEVPVGVDAFVESSWGMCK